VGFRPLVCFDNPLHYDTTVFISNYTPPISKTQTSRGPETIVNPYISNARQCRLNRHGSGPTRQSYATAVNNYPNNS